MQLSADAMKGVEIAQFRSFATKMPAYYLSVAAMMAATAYTFYGVGPWWLSLGIPAFFTLLSLVRGIWWWRQRGLIPSENKARTHLHRATILLVASASTVVWMDIALFDYGDLSQRYFILFHLLFAAVSGFFCLMHLRLVASMVGIGVMVPFVFLMYSLHQPGDHASALDGMVMAAVMVFAMQRYQRDFIHLIRSQSETIRLSTENIRLADIDALTGLQNRRQFFEALQVETANPFVRTQFTVAVGIVDLDGFKPVNDTHGHRVGDAVLVNVASCLAGVSTDIVQLCRVGGNEFAFIVRGECDEKGLLSLGQRLIDRVSQPIRIGDLITSVGCSVGFAVFPDAAETADLLYERANHALYHAKRTGRARAVVFSENHQRLIQERGLVEQTLRRADLAAEFYPLFQPIVDTASGQTVAFECLARWASPALGLVSPGLFIPIAEQAGIIGKLTPILLEKALAAAQHWPAHVHLSFNVSPYDIASRDQTAAMIALIRKSGVAPQRIAIEVTETALLHNFTQVTAHLAMFRGMGVQISLDDFGTGYSSLSYVHALTLDKIKIDKSFIGDIESNPASRNIVRSVISLCRDMDFACVIEGVETVEQLQIVQQLGATLIQGFYFAKPMRESELGRFLMRSHLPQPAPQSSIRPEILNIVVLDAPVDAPLDAPLAARPPRTLSSA